MRKINITFTQSVFSRPVPPASSRRARFRTAPRRTARSPASLVRSTAFSSCRFPFQQHPALRSVHNANYSTSDPNADLFSEVVRPLFPKSAAFKHPPAPRPTSRNRMTCNRTFELTDRRINRLALREHYAFRRLALMMAFIEQLQAFFCRAKSFLRPFFARAIIAARSSSPNGLCSAQP